MISWKNYLENVIDDFRNKGYSFDYFVEMIIITNLIKGIFHMISLLNITCAL